MAEKLMRVASLSIHRSLVRARHAERRTDQGAAVVALERLEIEHQIRLLDERIAEYEEFIARLPDELPFKAGAKRLKFGSLSIDVVLSTKPELKALVAVLIARRSRLAGPEGARRIKAAEALAAHLAGTAPDETEAPEAAEPESDPAPVGEDRPPPSKWGW
jgi:hypothetical protein